MNKKIHDDLLFLLDCFAEVLHEIGEGDLVAYLPKKDFRPVETHPYPQPDSVVELLSICFQLLNMVEENAAAMYRRGAETNTGLDSIPGLWGEMFKKTREYGVSQNQILNLLPTIECEPVLTAHPTEAKRASVLGIHRELYLLLVKNENSIWSTWEKKLIRKEIKSALERLWRTGEIYLEKPDIAHERSNVAFYLSQIFPEVLTVLDDRFRQAWVEYGGQSEILLKPELWPKICFGNWVGGDRDGHPFVTSDFTLETLHAFKSLAMEIHKTYLMRALRALSLSDRMQTCPSTILTSLENWYQQDTELKEKVLKRNPNEPWRQFCHCLLLFLEKGISISEYKKQLRVLRESLLSIQADLLVERFVFPLERLAQTFGFHLAKTDIRQNSEMYAIALEQILECIGSKDFSYRKWSESSKLEFLLAELNNPRPFLLPSQQMMEASQKVLDTFRTIQTFIQKNGKEAVGSFIVSMTENVSDLLLVYLFCKETGILEKDNMGELFNPFQVVPLFETIEDLKRAPLIMDTYLSFPIVQRSYRGQSIQIMLGYSDSNKDGGIFASQWNLYNAELQLTAIANKHNVKFKFFHGRGGTISRGGGKTHKFLDALPHGTLSGDIRTTVQGESIAQQFANKLNAVYNLELLLATTTKVTLRHKYRERKPHPAAPILDSLANLTKQRYQELLHTEGFMEFFSQATPIDAIENSKIGSRPSRRTGKRSLKDLRAIPWVFSWSQSRFFLPNWYGFGGALEYLFQNQAKDYEILKNEIPEWHFLKFLIRNIETGVYSSSERVYFMYAGLVEEQKIRDRFLSMIQKERELTIFHLNALRGKPLEESRPAMVETLLLRESSLETLHKLQVDALDTWRKNPDVPKHLESVLLTVNAIASGLRTTG
ncbi:phosphoenolpyruvate carboxylase [Leptospira ryugenii]|uniref:Phosphoenolpyruvate carboxylase n=1 Tax=Leptospira ryugenii TaxID=1917863 RepID=A0A2P2DZS5_9LEPT|nr:phosphoenolpyruvate carboxylase [Leptospira ryugenii]GBF50123.1 phosphoenolpyruvate carboxylase [Leptospira ryugenii]